jgi:hypothetical protein
MLYCVEVAFGHDRNGKPLPENDILAAQIVGGEILTRYFSGVQLSLCLGGYVTPKGYLKVEKCSVLRSYTDSLDTLTISQIDTLSAALAMFLGQQSVLFVWYELKGELRLVSPRRQTSKAEHLLAFLRALRTKNS